MKHAKKLASLLLALVMVMGLATTAFAAEEKGSITINNAVVGQTYTIYRILAWESTDDSTGAYAYKATTAWSNFINSDAIKDKYVNVDTEGYVTWITNADAAEFAKLAQAYAADSQNNVADQGSEKATSTTVTFSNLDLGYYLVDSTLGTLCSLDTTNLHATIQEKNEAPGNEKKVEEDSTSSYGTTNDADIGQTVNFQSTITAQAGAENYVFHDKMSEGLTYGSVTGITLNGNAVDNTSNKAYTVNASPTDGDTFDITFTQAFCDSLKANDQIVISYTATVNENAVVGDEGNKNESKVEYGDEGKTTTTPPSETKTYTWDVDVFKYTEGEDEDGNKTEKPLSGATFTLSKNDDGSDPIALVREKDDQGNDTNTYRVAKTGETGTVTEITTDATGRFTIKGLDSDTYYLTETKAPEGYNQLAGSITVVIDKDGKTTVGGTVVNEVKVLNQTGTELPSTGGRGTTIFYVLGGILVVGAVVLLVTKKRMSAEK